MDDGKIVMDLLEYVKNNDLFKSITPSPRINQLILKLDSCALAYDTKIEKIIGTTASNPVIIEQEEDNCKFCFFSPVVLRNVYSQEPHPVVNMDPLTGSTFLAGP